MKQPWRTRTKGTVKQKGKKFKAQPKSRKMRGATKSKRYKPTKSIKPTKLIEFTEDQIKDEVKGVKEYGEGAKIAQEAGQPEVAKAFTDIKKQEAEHLQKNEKILEDIKKEPEIKFFDMATGKEIPHDEFLSNLDKQAKEIREKADSEASDSRYMGTGWKGDKYEQTRNLPLKEIAQLIKKEILAKHPDIKVSVKTEHYSGGRSIGVIVNDVPFKAFQKVPENPDDQSNHNFTLHYTDQGKALIDSIQGIVKQYNYDRSNPMEDYSDTSFYADTDFGFDLRRKEEKELGVK